MTKKIFYVFTILTATTPYESNRHFFSEKILEVYVNGHEFFCE